MSLIEDLVLRFTTSGTKEAAAETDLVGGSVTKADEAAKSATKSHAALGKSFGGLASMAKNAAGTIGLAGLAFGVGDAVKNAAALQDAQKQLGSSLHANVRRPAADATDQMTQFAESMSTRGGWGATENIQNLTQLVRVTHSVTGAQKDLTLSTDVSRGAHVSLERAVRAVMMAEQGHATGLSRLGVTIKPVTTAVDALHATYAHATPAQLAAAKATDLLATKQVALASLTQKYGGAMSSYAHSAAGSMNTLHNSVEILLTQLGKILLPILVAVAGALVKLMGPLKTMLPVILAVAAAWGVYKTEQVLAAAATAITETALWGELGAAIALIPSITSLSDAWVVLNGVMDANPFGLIVLAIAAVTVAFIELYKHCSWFRDLVKSAMHDAVLAFDWLKQAAGDAFQWIKQNWPMLIPILMGPFAPLAEVIVQIIEHFHTLESVAETVVGAIVGFMTSLPRKIASATSHLWDGLKHGLVAVLNWIIDKFNGLPFIHGFHLGPIHVGGIPTVHHISAMAGGGPVSQTGSYLVGERGPEVVTLPGGSYVTPNQGDGGLGGLAHAIASMANRPIVINNIVDGKVLSQSVVRQGMLQAARSG